MLQAVVADLTADQPDLGPPLKDLVGRQQFQSLIPLASAGTGGIQRDALILQISGIYHPNVLAELKDFLNGFLESPEGGTKNPAEALIVETRASEMRTSPAREDRLAEMHRSRGSAASRRSPSEKANKKSRPQSVQSRNISKLYGLFVALNALILLTLIAIVIYNYSGKWGLFAIGPVFYLIGKLLRVKGF